jgi:hypothetical protein
MLTLVRVQFSAVSTQTFRRAVSTHPFRGRAVVLDGRHLLSCWAGCSMGGGDQRELVRG